jgi:hypothetical protein
MIPRMIFQRAEELEREVRLHTTSLLPHNEARAG